MDEKSELTFHSRRLCIRLNRGICQVYIYSERSERLLSSDLRIGGLPSQHAYRIIIINMPFQEFLGGV